MLRAVALVPLFFSFGCGSPAAPAPEAPVAPTAAETAKPAAPSAPISITATLRGKPVTIECKALAVGDPLADQSAMYVGGDQGAMLSCADPTTKLAVNTYVTPLTVGTQTPSKDSESHGRITAVLKDPNEVVTTLGGAATGSITVTSWDPTTGHLVGSASMQYAKDGTGQPGTAKVAFDVTVTK